MALSHADGPGQQVKDNVGHDPADMRLGVESGRVLSLLLFSTVLLAGIFAFIWLTAV